MGIAILIGAGFFAGVLGSALGLGGGIILVPALVNGAGLSIKAAIPCSMAAVLINSIRSSQMHLSKKNVHLPLASLIETMFLLFALFGTSLTLLFEAELLTNIFILVIFLICLSMVRDLFVTKNIVTGNVSSDEKEERAKQTNPNQKVGKIGQISGSLAISDIGRPVVVSFFSCLSGLLAGMLGIGGGILQVPNLNLAGGLSMQKAAGTTTYAMGAAAAGSALVFYLSGQVDLHTLIWVVLGINAGVFFAGKYLLNVSQSALKVFFIIVLVIVGVKMWMR